jgi:hypothetical protein
MAHIGHPVAGDPLYGGGKDEFGLGGQCLHAKQIEFDHPATGEAHQARDRSSRLFQKGIDNTRKQSVIYTRLQEDEGGWRKPAERKPIAASTLEPDPDNAGVGKTQTGIFYAALYT